MEFGGSDAPREYDDARREGWDFEFDVPLPDETSYAPDDGVHVHTEWIPASPDRGHDGAEPPPETGWSFSDPDEVGGTTKPPTSDLTEKLENALIAEIAGHINDAAWERLGGAWSPDASSAMQLDSIEPAIRDGLLDAVLGQAADALVRTVLEIGFNVTVGTVTPLPLGQLATTMRIFDLGGTLAADRRAGGNGFEAVARCPSAKELSQDVTNEALRNVLGDIVENAVRADHEPTTVDRDGETLRTGARERERQERFAELLRHQQQAISDQIEHARLQALPADAAESLALAQPQAWRGPGWQAQPDNTCPHHREIDHCDHDECRPYGHGLG